MGYILMFAAVIAAGVLAALGLGFALSLLQYLADRLTSKEV